MGLKLIKKLFWSGLTILYTSKWRLGQFSDSLRCFLKAQQVLNPSEVTFHRPAMSVFEWLSERMSCGFWYPPPLPKAHIQGLVASLWHCQEMVEPLIWGTVGGS